MSTYFIPRAHSNNQSTAYALIISTSKENANPDPRHNRPTEDPNPKETESEQGDDRVPSTGATGHAARSCGVYRRRRRRPPPPPQAQPRRRPPPRPGRPASGSPAAANSPAPCPIRPPRQQQQQPEPGAPSQERRHRETGERNPPLRATQTSPRDRRERQVGAAGTQSRLTSASRSFLQACSHTHSQLPRGSALFLPHPETLTPSEYAGKKKSFGFRFVLFFLGLLLRSGMGTCSRGGCGHEASRKLLAATHAATWARAWPGLGRLTYRRGGGPPVSGPCPAGSNDRIGRCGYLSLARRV